MSLLRSSGGVLRGVFNKSKKNNSDNSDDDLSNDGNDGEGDDDDNDDDSDNDIYDNDGNVNDSEDDVRTSSDFKLAKARKKMGKYDVVDMCCGWAMVPICEILETPNKPIKFKMSGGTPFSLVQIKKEEVQQRNSIKSVLKNAMGYEQLDTILTFQVNPVKLIMPSNTKEQIESESNATEKKENTYLFLTEVLPPNIVLPCSAVTLIAIYRSELMRTMNAHEDYAERVLPQSSDRLHSADVLFSSFPKILSDRAAARVLYMLWKLEAPEDERHRKFASDGTQDYSRMTISSVTDKRIKESYRKIVLSMWMAYNCPQCQPNPLKLIETAEDTYHREQVIRTLVGVPQIKAEHAGITRNFSSIPTPKTNSDTNENVRKNSVNNVDENLRNSLVKSISKLNANSIVKSLPEKKATVDPHLYLHTPFNARELLWTGRKIHL